MDVVRGTFELSSVDIICVSETWFRHDISDTHYEIKNYSLLRTDRIDKKVVEWLYTPKSI